MKTERAILFLFMGIIGLGIVIAEGGTGTPNFITKFIDTQGTIGDSNITDSGTAVNVQTQLYEAGSRVCTIANGLCNGTGPAGPAGPPGTNGTNGTNGTDGISVINATILSNGSLNITLSNGTSFISGNLTGPQGTQGPAGTDSSSTPNPKKYVAVELEFINANGNVFGELLGTAINSGNMGAGIGNQTHPGTISLIDSTTAQGGYRIVTLNTVYKLNGTENATAILMTGPSKLGNSTTRFGFFDTTTNAASVDECSFNITRGILNIAQGWCASNSARTSTNTSYPTINNTWYGYNIYIDELAKTATFSIYNESGSLLWNDTIYSNIPTATNRETGFGIIATQDTTDAASALIWIDYISLTISRDLNRWY